MGDICPKKKSRKDHGHDCCSFEHDEKESCCHDTPCHDGRLISQNCCLPVTCSPLLICDDRIRVRVAGLNANLNFQLFRLKGCPVEVEYDCTGSGGSVQGTICGVGTNFVDILLNNGTVVTLLLDRICRINWTDPNCNPCVPLNPPENPCQTC